MKIKLDSLRVLPFDEIELGTLIRSTTDGWSHVFERAIIIDGGYLFEGRALLPLDGEYTLQAIPRTNERQSFLVGQARTFWVDGIDKIDQEAYSNTDGALIVTPRGPVLRAQWRDASDHFARPCYIDMTTWQIIKFANEVPHEAFGRWQLLVADADGRNEAVILELAPGGRI